MNLERMGEANKGVGKERSERDEWNEWDWGEKVDWGTGETAVEKTATWNEVAEMAGQFDENDQKRVWGLPEKPVREVERKQNGGETVKLDEAMEELQDGRYELLGHGTTTVDLAERIMNEGVEVGGSGRDTDIDSNFYYLDHDYENLKKTLDNWQHEEAQQIVLVRVPVKYKLPFAGLGKNTYGVFYHDKDEHGTKGVYEGDYVYGWYDAESGMVRKNANYHGSLDNEEDVKYMEEVYQGIKQSYLETLPEDEREDWEELTKMYYDYVPE